MDVINVGDWVYLTKRIQEFQKNPINMRDGSLICVGKGNEDWNYSAPHGEVDL